MQYPKLKPAARKRYLIHRFGGYDHSPEPASGCFYDMRNLSGKQWPHMSVRPRRTKASILDGCPAQRVLAIGGGAEPVLLDASGSLWSGGNVLPKLLPGITFVSVSAPDGYTVETLKQHLVSEHVPADGSFQFRFDRKADEWRQEDYGFHFPAHALTLSPLQTDGTLVTLRLNTNLNHSWPRQLVFLGGWVCVFPDGAYANVARLRQGDSLYEWEDYGTIAMQNRTTEGSIRLEPCGIDGTLWNVTSGDTAPENGYWEDTSEPEPVMKCFSSSQNLWVAVNPYIKCSIPGIARGVFEGDAVSLYSRLASEEENFVMAGRIWQGRHVLRGVFHDHGDSLRPEGTNDYVIVEGMLSAPISLTLDSTGKQIMQLTRLLPPMDFVVSCQNRLWGCKYGDGINELYASKLGDLRNWNVFEGLSTDSWRASRGQDGPFTGAAVLGDCPLFFRENCLEKVYPAAGGNHKTVTLSLSGIEAGSHRSAVVIRDRLYYKSPHGVCCYNGTLPVSISQPLGQVEYRNAVAGYLRDQYYILMENADREKDLFVFDTINNLWYKEEALEVDQFWSGTHLLYALSQEKASLSCIGGCYDSDDVQWYAETGDLFPILGTRRYISRLRVTARLDPGAELRVLISYDDGPWLRKGSFYANSVRSICFPVWPRRCDHLRLRLEGSGGMELQQLSFLLEAGSDE